MSDTSLTAAAKLLACEEGFARVGIASAGSVPGGERYRRWLAAGKHAGMTYLAENVEKRHQPSSLVESAKSVICLAVSYAPADATAAGDAPVARYARGRDYHKVLKRRCHRLMDRLRQIEPGLVGRAFVDTAPIAERSVAASAGLGWIGRNGCLIASELGSYVLLCEIVCNLSLTPDSPTGQDCGDCRKCIDACPTGAIGADGEVDSRLCRSYLTIEHRSRIDRGLWAKMGDRLLGCDTCQSACPHNESLSAGDAALMGRPDGDMAMAAVTVADVLGWSPEDWDAATRGSAARRATHGMWLRNAVLAAGNSGDAGLIGALERLAGSRDELTEEIAWAISRIGQR